MSCDDANVAAHEAAHAVIAVALNLPVSHVQLGTDPRFYFADEPADDRRRDHIRVLMAGAAGEQLLGHEPEGTGADDPAIAALLTADDDEATLRHEVRRFIAANYPAVMRVAAALRRDGVLTGDEVERLVRQR